MFNLFYEPDYGKRKKKFFTLNFSNSVLLNIYIDFSYLFNFILIDKFITNGPLKLMNNILKSVKGEKVSINKIKYKDSYIVQFDDFGERALEAILKKYGNKSKVLIGPLFTRDHLNNLLGYVNRYPFIQIVTVSHSAKLTLLNDLKLNVDPNRICVLPIGVIKKKKLLNPNKKNFRNEKCLVYFKNRKQEDLVKVLDLLKNKKINFDLVKYGKYQNSTLIRLAKRNKFGILINSTESQGFAVQEMLSNGLPLLVWNERKSKFEGIEINGTSVPYWDENCGIKVDNFEELKNNLDFFIKDLDKFLPQKIINEFLTYEKFLENIKREFIKIKL